MTKLSLYQTNNGNFRVLVNGKVHPLLVGFEDILTATVRAQALFPDYSWPTDQSMMAYPKPDEFGEYYYVGRVSEMFCPRRRFLPSELEMYEIDSLILKNQLNNIQVDFERDNGEIIKDRFLLIYRDTHFTFNTYDVYNLPVSIQKLFFRIKPSLNNIDEGDLDKVW